MSLDRARQQRQLRPCICHAGNVGIRQRNVSYLTIPPHAATLHDSTHGLSEKCTLQDMAITEWLCQNSKAHDCRWTLNDSFYANRIGVVTTRASRRGSTNSSDIGYKRARTHVKYRHQFLDKSIRLIFLPYKLIYDCHCNNHNRSKHNIKQCFTAWRRAHSSIVDLQLLQSQLCHWRSSKGSYEKLLAVCRNIFEDLLQIMLT